MPGRIGNITFDCADALAVATFWSQVLGRSIDDGSDHGFASIGRHDATRSIPSLFFEVVPEAKTAKNRVHIDVIDSDPHVVGRLVALGATIVSEHSSSGGHGWTVMSDPEGNEFCVSVDAYTS
jgi:predicted enzyme related to lactoylglutathione lyase